MTKPTKVQETKARRKAERQDRILVKSRLRDPQAVGYGLWQVQDIVGRPLREGLTFEQVEAFLAQGLP